VTDRVQEVLVFVTVALASAYLVRKLLFPGGEPKPSSKPDVPVSALRKKPGARGARPGPGCH
jgi:hypothetical protein